MAGVITPFGSSASLQRKPSHRRLVSLSGGATVWFFYAPPEPEEPSDRHFLNACSLCEPPLRQNRDIYMCRGDVPFCSEECRQEWIDVEAAREEEAMACYRSISHKAAAAAPASIAQGQQGMRRPPERP